MPKLLNLLYCIILFINLNASAILTFWFVQDLYYLQRKEISITNELKADLLFESSGMLLSNLMIVFAVSGLLHAKSD